VQRQKTLENVRATPDKPRFNLPKEMLDEVKKHLPEAKEVGDKLHELVEKGSPAQVALVCQEPIRKFLSAHLTSIMPQIAQTFAQADRSQLMNFFQQICRQRLAQNNVGTEKIDQRTYEIAVSDFMNLISRVPAQVLPIEVGLPDLNLDTPETPEASDTAQGEQHVGHGTDNQ
jgi:hypothetical protein